MSCYSSIFVDFFLEVFINYSVKSSIISLLCMLGYWLLISFVSTLIPILLIVNKAIIKIFKKD